MIKEMNKIRELAQLAMKSAQDKAKHYADKKRLFCEFYVKL